MRPVQIRDSFYLSLEGGVGVTGTEIIHKINVKFDENILTHYSLITRNKQEV